jgi:hypothetical protein
MRVGLRCDNDDMYRIYICTSYMWYEIWKIYSLLLSGHCISVLYICTVGITGAGT